MKRLTIEMDDELYKHLSHAAEIRHETVEDAMVGFLRTRILFDFPHIDTGGFTEAAMKLDRTKNGWWEEMEDERRPS